MIVDDPSGITWRVKRRWLPWRLRRRDPDLALDAASGIDADDLVAGVAIFVAVVVMAVLVPFVAVLAVLVAELFLLLLLLPLFIALRAGRVARWPIEGWRDGRLVHAEVVRGWRNSRLRISDLVEAIRRGDGPHPGASPSL